MTKPLPTRRQYAFRVTCYYRDEAAQRMAAEKISVVVAAQSRFLATLEAARQLGTLAIENASRITMEAAKGGTKDAT